MTAVPNPDHEALVDDAVVNMRRSLAALTSAAATVRLPVSPQMARGVQATENAWREMNAEFGLLSGAEVAARAGSTARTRSSYAADRRRAGTLLGIRRKNAYLYPGFQFDDTGHVRPVITALLSVASRHGVSAEGLAQWLCAPTGQLGDQRPVDHLDEEERVLSAAENHYGVQW